MQIRLAAMGLAALALPLAQSPAQSSAQSPAQPSASVQFDFEGQNRACPATAANLIGAVLDPTQALIPGATITLDNDLHATTGSDGRYHFPCVPAGHHHLSAAAEGFASRDLDLTTPHAAITLTLSPADVQTEVDVSGTDATPATSANGAGPTQTLSGKQLQQLADDPDDLLRELQQLAAATGGNPANTTIAVDGFQGSSALPPKSSIAYIKINPDQFAAEYREPPFDGGRVEVYTKPGAKNFHGALFLTNGSAWENARDPFSASKAAIGKQRYGFELSGPVRPWVRGGQGSDFALTLEHRIINNFAAVDAFTLNSSGATVETFANVPTPQHLWLATARVSWQLSPRNTFITSYSANANSLQNLGVGGTTLAEAGASQTTYEHMFRVSDVTTFTPHLMHESRLSLRFDGSNATPNSTASSIQVAGAFTGGGASVGPQKINELNIEFDDDAILTTKAHTIKFGAQLMSYIEHQQLTTNFNGSYVFGNLAQYQAATPIEYSAVTGTPTVDFSQQRGALFFEDDWNAGHNLHIAYGLRYFYETNPNVLDGATPRLGILWSPNKKGTWTLHAHAGMFTGNISTGTQAEVLREDGISRHTGIAYNPIFCVPSSSCNPLAGSNSIQSVRQYSPHLSNILWAAENIGGTRTLPFGFNLSLDFYIGRIWNDLRTLNINSPTNGMPNGPRPIAPNLNILQVQNSAQSNINAIFGGVENHTIKHLQFFFGGVHVNIFGDGDDNPTFSPQSAYSNAGEFARRTGQTPWNLFGSGTLTLPEKIQLSTNFNAGGDSHYNITTGLDNNGDGDFNDRPQYATPGTPGAIQTQYGLLTANYTGQPGVNVFPRNAGVLPWTFHVDTNLQRAFALTRNPKADHQQTLTLNIRSSNVLNHLNVTQMGGVLGSPLFGQPYAADNGRRVELGARYSF
jgi:Carboxypeptidase regulatory-like domain